MVASLHGMSLEGGLIFNVPELRVIILTVATARDAMAGALRVRPWIEAVVMPNPQDLPGAFRAVRTLGVRRISAIGGRTIAAALADAGLVKDLYLTTSA